MGTVNAAGMRAAEAAAMASGWSEEQLLNLAGTRLGHALGRFFPRKGTAIGYLGKGHNAGDTLVALRVLRDGYGWDIAVRNAYALADRAPLTMAKWRELALDGTLEEPPRSVTMNRPLVLLDGLLGIGANGPLRPPLATLAAEMEQLRQQAGAIVAAVDLPSGLHPDTGESAEGTVTADITFMIGNAKSGALHSRAVNTVGALALVPVEPLASSSAGTVEMICPQEMNFAKAPRPFDFHKGLAGRVAVVAGSERYPGAAVLAATGALRAGAGLVTLHVPAGCAATIAPKCPPEIIIRSIKSFRDIPAGESDALVVGCGMGPLDEASAREFPEWMLSCRMPVVIDADALNWIAATRSHDLFADHHILTPHPGEFRRLAPDLDGIERERAVRIFTGRHPATLLLKGGRTLVTRDGDPVWCNSTGHPGMGTGGQGDLLAGVIGALLAGGLPPVQSAAFGAWLCGRASETALTDPGCSAESLTPSDSARMLGAAFHDWRAASR